MNRFRLRGTWEEDPAPIPFPAGRSAGADSGAHEAADAIDRRTDDRDAMSTDEVIEAVEGELDRLTLRIDELRAMVTPFPDGSDPDPAA